MDKSEVRELLTRALQNQQSGHFRAAESIYIQVLEEEPDNWEVLYYLGFLKLQVNELNESIHWLLQALELRPDAFNTYYALGNAYQQKNEFEPALEYYLKALKTNPGTGDIYYNIGTIYNALNQFETAIDYFQKALAFQPQAGHYHNNYANALRGIGDMKKALKHYRLAQKMSPREPSVYNNLGNCFREMGLWEEAIRFFRQAISMLPDHPLIYINLAMVYQDKGQYNSAIPYYKKALQKAPDFIDAYKNLGFIFQSQGRLRDAIKCFEYILAVNPTDGMRIRLATLLPYVYGSKEELIEYRESLSDNIENLLNEELSIIDPISEYCHSHFLVAYAGFNDRDIMVRLAQLYRPFLPESLMQPKKRESAKIKLGFISVHFYNHSVSHCFSRLIEKVPPEFETVLFLIPGGISDHVTEDMAEQVTDFVHLPKELSRAQQILSEQELDILVYTDIGMEIYSYFLAFTRFAPIQCVLSGHPVTTGIPTIDYFISSKLLENDDAQQHYSEQLILLDNIAVDYQKPILPGQLKTKEELNLPTENHLYICPTTLFKVHPDFDLVLAEILKKDPAGKAVFFKSNETALHQQLLQRFKQSVEDLEQIIFLPWASPNDLLMILNHADVVLDTFPFSAGNTAYLTLSVGTPLVTYSSEFLRGRSACGLYQQMEMTDLIASSYEDYVEIAVKLATNSDYRQRIKEKILKQNHILYNNQAGVNEFYQQLKTILATSKE